MWLLTPGNYWFVMLTAVVPFAFATYAGAAVLFGGLLRGAGPRPRRWYAGATALALAGTLLHGALLAPAYLGGHATGEPDLTVMTLNLRKGGADVAEVVRLVRQRDVTVLVLAEVTPAAQDRLRGAGLTETLPYVAGRAAAGTEGTMVFSAYELSAQRPIASRNGAAVMRVAAPAPFWLLAVHTSQPLAKPYEWAKDWRAINAAAAGLDGARIVAGDFNATLDHRPVRRLLDSGLADAARAADSGWQPTWPALAGRVGLLAIDHVLVSTQFGVVDTSAPQVEGTDHRALLADLTR